MDTTLSRVSSTAIRRWLALVAAVALSAGCTVQLGSSSANDTEATSASTGPPSTASLPTASAASPSGQAAPGAPVPRTTQGMSHALLALDDVAAGFTVEPPTDPADTLDLSAGPGNSGCGDFVAMTNAAHLPGSTATASISFSGGQDGPFVDETLEAQPDANAAVSVLELLRKSIASCSRVRATVSGNGTPSQVLVRVVKAPAYGAHPVAVRLTASGGDLDGFEMTTVATAVADTVLTLDFIGFYPEDIDAVTYDAVGKATAVLLVGPAT